MFFSGKSINFFQVLVGASVILSPQGRFPYHRFCGIVM
jgi:hypothetical protein